MAKPGLKRAVPGDSTLTGPPRLLCALIEGCAGRASTCGSVPEAAASHRPQGGVLSPTEGYRGTVQMEKEYSMYPCPYGGSSLVIKPAKHFLLNVPQGDATLIDIV